MLAALDLRLVARLIVAASILMLALLAAALLMLAGRGLVRSLLRALVGMLATFYLRFVAGLVMGTSVILVRHKNFSDCCKLPDVTPGWSCG
jgi:hypothetical protein